MNTRPRIVQVASYYPPHLGGLERVIKEISEQLAKDGYDTTVLTSCIDSGDAPRVENEHKLMIHRLWAFEFAHVAVIPGLFWRLLRTPKPAIIHLHLAQVFTPEMVWIVSKLRRIPYVVHFHLDVEPSGAFGFIFVWWKRWVQPVIIRSAAQVITLSPDQTKLIVERYKVAPEKVTYLSNGVGEKFLTIGRETRNTHSPLRLLYVGRFTSQKRVDRIIKAMPMIDQQVSLQIVGDGEDKQELLELAKSNTTSNIVFSGRLDGEKLLDAYRSADIFLLPSEREGMPLVMLEAMAAGLPIIGSDVLGINEFVKGVGILVANPSPETFASAINDLATHPERLPALSEASLRKAEEYSWNKLVARLEDIYREVRSS